MKITINAVYFILLFVMILMILNFATLRSDIANLSTQLDRIEQQLAVCLPASQREGGAE